MTEPMSEERLHQVRRDIKRLTVKSPDSFDMSDLQDAGACALIYVPELLAEVERLRDALEREHEDRTREYDYANADGEAAAKRIRELITENAAMREIVRQVINVPPYEFHDNTDCFFHGDCYPEWVSEGKGYWKHHPECLVTKARARCAARR